MKRQEGLICLCLNFNKFACSDCVFFTIVFLVPYLCGRNELKFILAIHLICMFSKGEVVKPIFIFYIHKIKSWQIKHFCEHFSKSIKES